MDNSRAIIPKCPRQSTWLSILGKILCKGHNSEVSGAIELVNYLGQDIISFSIVTKFLRDGVKTVRIKIAMNTELEKDLNTNPTCSICAFDFVLYACSI